MKGELCKVVEHKSGFLNPMYHSMKSGDDQIDSVIMNSECDNKTFIDENGVSEFDTVKTVLPDTSEHNKAVTQANMSSKPNTDTCKQTKDNNGHLKSKKSVTNGKKILNGDTKSTGKVTPVTNGHTHTNVPGLSTGKVTPVTNGHTTTNVPGLSTGHVSAHSKDKDVKRKLNGHTGEKGYTQVNDKMKSNGRAIDNNYATINGKRISNGHDDQTALNGHTLGNDNTILNGKEKSNGNQIRHKNATFNGHEVTNGHGFIEETSRL